MYLERVMCLGRRDVGLVKLDRRGRERLLGIAAVALQSLDRSIRCLNYIRVVVRLKVSLRTIVPVNALRNINYRQQA